MSDRSDLGDTITIGDDRTTVVVAPEHGGRVAQVTIDGTRLLVERHSAPDTAGPIAWGSYPMVPWAGRIRDGRFVFRNRIVDLPRTLGPHAIHGVGFSSPWRVDHHDPRVVELDLDLPTDLRWPFGGRARQRIEIVAGGLRLELSVSADRRAFPASLGWHPWFRKPSSIEFRPTAMFRRDRFGITVDELVDVPPGPWDDCFVNDRPVVVTIDGCPVELTSDCTNWVVYDERDYATCIEPQTGPPDAVNIRPQVIEPGSTLSAWYRITAVA